MEKMKIVRFEFEVLVPEGEDDYIMDMSQYLGAIFGILNRGKLDPVIEPTITVLDY